MAEIQGPMSGETLAAFLSEPILARIATIKGNQPHVVPMWFDWDGESIWMETGYGFRKHKNLLENPNCAVTIDVTEGGLRFKGAIMEGVAEIITDTEPFIRDTVVRIYRKYLGDAGILDPTPQEMINSPHAIIRLQPARILTWDETGSVP
jgi:nitroimidazol reductase NimA-like FMN-containing flavoprotein (pyridoxamine 5'-phosphate oxidase superfamily)